MRLYSQIDGKGKPLIILHGFLGSVDNWQVMGKRLSQSYKVCSLDLRNHGRSSHSDLMNYPAMAEDVHEFIAEQNLSGTSMLGHSMGGKVAMQFATRFPDEIEKLIIVDIAPKAYPPAHNAILHAMRNVDLPAYKSFGEVGDALTPVIAYPAVRKFLMKNLARDASGTFYWRLGLDQIIKNYDELTKPIIGDKLFTKPVCFIRGGRSNFVQDSDLPAIHGVFPIAEFHTVPDAGHWVHIDGPDQFHTIVTNFLGSAARS